MNAQSHTAVAVSVTKPPLGVYEWLAVVGAMAYFTLPLGILFPVIYETVAGVAKLEGSRLAGFRSLMTLVTPIGLIYLFAVWNRFVSLIDLTLVWRLLWVGPWIVANTLTGALEFRGALVIGGLDLGLPLLALVLAPRRRQLWSRLREHYREAAAPTIAQRILQWDARIGFVLVTGLAVMRLTSGSHAYVESFAISVVALYYLFLYWAARQPGATVVWFAVAIRLVLIGGLVLCGAYGFLREPLLTLGTYALIGCFLHAYTALWERQMLGKSEWTIARWVTVASLAMMAISLVWMAVSPLFPPHARQLAVNIHRQDLIIGIFAILVGVLLMETKPRAPRHSMILSWLLPMSAVWFTLETKLLANLGVGSPFHPSWVERGLAPRYAGIVAVDLTFSLATVLMTALSTNYAAFILLRYLPREGWRLLVWHGILVIGLSAFWMIIASSGVPAPIAGLPDMASIPPFIPVDAVAAVALHIRDLLLGIVLIAAGLVLDRTARDTSHFAAWTVGGVWALFLIPKLYLHFKIGL